MTEYTCLHDGSWYDPTDAPMMTEQLACLDAVHAYNQLPPSDTDKRRAMLREMFAEVGDGCYIEAPFYANWGGRFVRLGHRVYANYHLTLVDDTYITIGDDTMIGPNVTIATAEHPLTPSLRRQGLQRNRPVHIGRNCWIGAGAIILPGVTIGDDTVIGAGSVVTRDIPSRVVAVGNPCRVLRAIEDE